MKIDLSGKTALVTGASGGLGRVISRRLAECGADLALHYFSDEVSAIRVRDSIIREYGVKAEIFKCDITKEAEVARLKEEVAAFHMPDLIVPNAVVQYEFKSLLETDIRHFYSQFESCVMQTVYLMKQFLPHMIEQNYGRIVAINTECSYLAEPTFSAYAAGKRGLDGIVRVLAKEVGEHNITINQVAPGWTLTDKERLAANSEEQKQAVADYVNTVPLKRRGTDDDIANMVAFLLSDYASFTTGAYIPVSGGRVMPGI